MKLRDAEHMGVVWHLLVTIEGPVTTKEIREAIADWRTLAKADMGPALRSVAAAMTADDIEAAAFRLVKRGEVRNRWRECERCDGECCSHGAYEWSPRPGEGASRRGKKKSRSTRPRRPHGPGFFHGWRGPVDCGTGSPFVRRNG